MTDKPKPERLQPRSTSPFADGNSEVKPPAPTKKNAFSRAPIAKPKAEPPKKLKVEAGNRQRMMTEEQRGILAAKERQEEAAAAEEQAAPIGHNSGRVPFGNQSAKMRLPEREGFTRRWFNDKPGRIALAIGAGYKMVEDPLTGKPYELTVNQSASANNAMKAYGMEIPNEFYDEDFALKQQSLDFTDEAIYKGTNNEKPGDKRYVPPDLMKFRTKRGPGSEIA